MFNSAFNSFSFHFTYKGLCEKLTAENGRDIKENERESYENGTLGNKMSSMGIDDRWQF